VSAATKTAPAGASQRRPPVRRTMIEAAARRQSAEVARPVGDALPDPVAMHGDERQAVRERAVQRLRAMAFRVVAQCNAVAGGGPVDDLTDALDELEACGAETVPWLRAARGER
jgi:hypothetical protein